MPKTKDGRHPFKWLVYDGVKVRIDRDIVSLLTKMWALGIRTTNSCQAHCNFACKHKWKTIKYKNGTSYSYHNRTKNCYNNVWLAFESVADVEHLYNIVAEYDKSSDDETMYNRMSCDRFVQTGQTRYRSSPEGWAFSFLMRNHGVDGHWGRPKWGNKRSTVEMWVEDGCKKNNFIMEPQITFPRKHIAYLEERLQLALDKRNKRHVGQNQRSRR